MQMWLHLITKKKGEFTGHRNSQWTQNEKICPHFHDQQHPLLHRTPKTHQQCDGQGLWKSDQYQCRGYVICHIEDKDSQIHYIIIHMVKYVMEVLIFLLSPQQ